MLLTPDTLARWPPQAGVYNFTYSPQLLADARRLGVTSIRLPVNLATAGDAATLARMRGFVEAVGGDRGECRWRGKQRISIQLIIAFDNRATTK